MLIHTLSTHPDLMPAAQAAYESYIRLVFPGAKSEKSQGDEDLELRKRILAEETKKAFIVRPISVDEMMKRRPQSPQAAKLMGAALHQEDVQRRKHLEMQAKAQAIHARAQATSTAVKLEGKK